MAELRREVSSLQAKLLDGVRRRRDLQVVVQRPGAAKLLNVVVDTIQPEILHPGIHAVDVEVVAVGRSAKVDVGSGRTGGNLGQSVEMAAEKRQIDDLLVPDRGAD